MVFPDTDLIDLLYYKTSSLYFRIPGTTNCQNINTMKISRLIILLAFLTVFPCMIGCNAQKDMTQRRNLMIPQKDELPRNSKYRGVKKRKTYKPKKKKNKRRRHACINNILFSTEQNRPA